MRRVPPKGATEVVHKGDRVLLNPAGSGGYGDPKQRPAEAVRRDVANGYVSVQAAAADYGIDASAAARDAGVDLV